MALDRFNKHAWEVDLAAQTVTHVSGFSARVCELPLTEAELRSLNSKGLVAVGTTRAGNGARWAVLATSEAIELAERWIEGEAVAGTARGRALMSVAHDAARAWLHAYLPPETLDERNAAAAANRIAR